RTPCCACCMLCTPHLPRRVPSASALPFVLLPRPAPPTSTLFPYTTLFRSHRQRLRGLDEAAGALGILFNIHRRLPSACRSDPDRSEEHTSELQSRFDLVCRLLLEKKKLM